MGKEMPHRYANKLIWAFTSIAYLSPWSVTFAISPSWLLFVPVVPGGLPLLSSLDQSEHRGLILPDGPHCQLAKDHLTSPTGPAINWQGPHKPLVN